MVTHSLELSINKKQFDDHLASFLHAASIVNDNEEVKTIEYTIHPDRIGLKLKIEKEQEGKVLTLNGKKEQFEKSNT